MNVIKRTISSQSPAIINHGEYQYLNLIQKIMNNGEKQNGRNGDVISLFGEKMDFSWIQLKVHFSSLGPHYGREN